MKKVVEYFVQDAWGYPCPTDELGFNVCVNTWQKHNCSYEIIIQEMPDYFIKKLFRK